LWFVVGTPLKMEAAQATPAPSGRHGLYFLLALRCRCGSVERRRFSARPDAGSALNAPQTVLAN